MKCRRCGSDDTKVLESRLSHEGRSVRRRRSCNQCRYRFTTYEREETPVFQIKKKEGHFEPYQHEKAARSIQIACQKRPVPVDRIEEILARVEKRMIEMGERTIPSERIGDLILEELLEVDNVAYIRFASVYKNFKNAEEFLQELRHVAPARSPSLSAGEPCSPA